MPNRLLELGVSSSVSGTCRHRPIAAVCSSKSQRASGRSRGKAAPKSAAAGGAAPAAPPSAPLPAPPAVLAPPPPPPFKQLMAAPEDFQAPSGQLIPVNVMHPPSPADVFKCIGCARPECQVGHCAAASKLVAGRQAGGGNVLCQPHSICVAAVTLASACRICLWTTVASGWQGVSALSLFDSPTNPFTHPSTRPFIPPPAAPQGPTGCTSVDLAWRREPEGYLKEILTARWGWGTTAAAAAAAEEAVKASGSQSVCYFVC